MVYMESLNDVTALPVTLAGHMNLQAVHNLSPPSSLTDRPLLHCIVRFQPRLSIVCCAVDLIPKSQCSQFLQLAYRGRRGVCYHHRLCYACLNTGHLQSSCTGKCGTCGGQHHRLLCNTAVTPEAPTRGVNVNAPSFSLSSTSQTI